MSEDSGYNTFAMGSKTRRRTRSDNTVYPSNTVISLLKKGKEMMKQGREMNPKAAKLQTAFHPQQQVLDTLVQLYSILIGCGKTGSNVQGHEVCLPGERGYKQTQGTIFSK
jgi:hypothetical protein